MNGPPVTTQIPEGDVEFNLTQAALDKSKFSKAIHYVLDLFTAPSAMHPLAPQITMPKLKGM